MNIQIFSRILLIFALLFFNFIPTNIFAKNSQKKKKDLHEVSLCAIFQNEAPYLKEWIEFHQLVGVTKFYLFNNLSKDDYQTVLNPYIESGIVELIEWPFSAEKFGWPHVQCGAYNKAVELTRKTTKWLAIIDTDEFIFPVKVKTLNDFLKDYKNYGAVAVNWQMYGTSFVEKINSNELLIEKLLLKAPMNYNENKNVKLILQPKYVKKVVNPHHARFKSQRRIVNSDKQVLSGSVAPYIVTDKIRINHYWSRDQDFFLRIKVERRQNWSDSGSFERLKNINQENDSIILKYAKELKKKMNLE